MNSFEYLLSLSEIEKREKGVEFTPKEIAQQPEIWKKVFKILKLNRAHIIDFITDSGLIGNKEAVIILTGAGSSEFIGNSITNVLRKRLRKEVLSIPTTLLTTHAKQTLIPHHKYVIISFSRSGNSPESLAVYNIVKRISQTVKQIIITCNKDGDLAKQAKSDKDSLCIFLPEESNDRSLAMTSSFSSLALMGIGLTFIQSLSQFSYLVDKIAKAVQQMIKNYSDLLYHFANKSFSRICFLGSNTLFGTMQECSLKLQEMTNGEIATIFNSYLGLRHGPQAFINNDCVVFASISSDAIVRKYEIDLLRELKEKKQGCGTLVICDHASEEIKDLYTDLIELFPKGDKIGDTFRIMTDVVAGQILATFKSIKLGYKPDNPSPSGTINRVVQSVVIYD